jgi:hypothetical protein
MGETCSTHGEIGKYIRNCNLKISREDTTGRPRHKSDDKNKINLKAIAS